MYFKNFPNTIYDFNIGNKDVAVYVTDITRNIRFRRDVLSNITIYDEYDIRDGEPPHVVAERIYDNPYYHWIVMLMNDRYDYKTDWPLSQNDLDKFITSKYGDQKYAIHHYQLNGFVVDSTTVGASSVSNYDYEVNLNESKRRIKIVPKALIGKILDDYKKLI